MFRTRELTETFLANDYGARGDGSTLNTQSIQKTMDAAAESGGTVRFKPGTYLTGSLFLKSGTTLDVDDGVALIGSQKLDDYAMLPTRVAGIEVTWPAALINVRDQRHVTIRGNPSYSYPTLPAGMDNVPPYWISLTKRVPEEQGLPHFRDIHIWNIKATGARQAFQVSAYPNATLDNFHLDHLDIEAKTAGFLANAKNWRLSDNKIKTADRSKVSFTNAPNLPGGDVSYGDRH